MQKIPAILLLLFMFSIASLAQSQSTTGNIEGRVVDQNGSVIPGIGVPATNKANGFGKVTSTDKEGNYIFVLLPPGTYKVEVQAGKGLAAATYDKVQVTVRPRTTLEVTLSVSGSTTVVDVTAAGQGIETTRSSIASTVDERRVINLPTNGRNFLDFATL